jgi:hypothetical protein
MNIGHPVETYGPSPQNYMSLFNFILCNGTQFAAWFQVEKNRLASSSLRLRNTSLSIIRFVSGLFVDLHEQRAKRLHRLFLAFPVLAVIAGGVAGKPKSIEMCCGYLPSTNVPPFQPHPTACANYRQKCTYWGMFGSVEQYSDKNALIKRKYFFMRASAKK